MLRDLAHRLELVGALKLAKSNDLLPPREDDKLSGELGKRFVEYLKKEIEEDRYKPTPASFVPVPKPGFTTRPAALLALQDRVVYEAIVAAVRPNLSKTETISDSVVLWPRVNDSPKRWKEFEKGPLEGEASFVVQSDISGFYESIDHRVLEDDLVKAGVDRPAASAIRAFLDEVMGGSRGLPQGLMASDTLATTYLRDVDEAMVKNLFQYTRHGDDVRITTETAPRAREAIFRVEELLRTRGLLINAAKVVLGSREVYEAELRAGDETFEKARNTLFAKNVESVTEDDEEFIAAMKEAGLDEQWGWDLFYHGSASVQEVIEAMREHLEPSTVAVMEHAFNEAMIHAPGTTEPMEAHVFHYVLLRTLVQLAAARSLVALSYMHQLLLRFPDKTEVIAQYLNAVMSIAPDRAVAEIEQVLEADTFLTPWQLAWLYRVLADGASYVKDTTRAGFRRVVTGLSGDWLSRVEAAKVLARCGDLDQEAFIECWRQAPEVYRCDLLVVAAICSNTTEWAKTFLAVVGRDPVEKAIVTHLREQFPPSKE